MERDFNGLVRGWKWGTLRRGNISAYASSAFAMVRGGTLCRDRMRMLFTYKSLIRSSLFHASSIRLPTDRKKCSDRKKKIAINRKFPSPPAAWRSSRKNSKHFFLTEFIVATLQPYISQTYCQYFHQDKLCFIRYWVKLNGSINYNCNKYDCEQSQGTEGVLA